MGQKDGRFIRGDTCQRQIDSGCPTEQIIDPRQPESAAAALDRQTSITQHRNPLPLQRAHDQGGIRPCIMISQDGVFWTLYLPQERRARKGGLRRFSEKSFALEDRYGDKVSGQHDQIGSQAIYQLYRFADWHRREVGLIVKVAELRDRKAVERTRKAPECNLSSHQLRMVRVNEPI